MTLACLQLLCFDYSVLQKNKYLTKKVTNSKNHGFTLIEVLIALAIIAIALTALLKATAQNITNTDRIKEKTVSHLIAMQAITLIQMNKIAASPQSTQTTSMLGEKWYWRIKISPTSLNKTQKITISMSQKQNGPFLDELIAFRYTSP